MSRLPTVGGDTDNWGTVLNEFLDSTYGFFRLNGNTSASATTITADRVPGVISANAGHYIVIDPFTVEAELRLVAGVSGNSITVAALDYTHASGDQVYFLTGTQGTVIPWTWWGGQGTGDAADASNNVLGFNRLSTQMRNTVGFGIGVDGTFCVNDELTPYESQAIIGTHPFASLIKAVSGFPFDDTGDVAIIHPQRLSGGPVLYRASGPSGRWWFRNIYVDGSHLTDSNGIISSPQQPDSMDNVRIDSCTGLYGLSLNDVQYYDMRNIQFNECSTSLACWTVGYLRVFNMNATTPTGPVAIDLEGTTDSSFYGALLETVPSPGKIFNVHNGSSRLGFYDIYTSGVTDGDVGDLFYIDSEGNPSGKCTYFISNAHSNLNSADFNLLTDVQRGIVIDSLSASDRSLVFGYAQDNLYEFVAGGNGVVAMSGPVSLPPFLTGPTIRSGAGTPEDAVIAPVGSLYLRTDGGASTTLYVKESGTGLLGWVAK